MTIKQCSVFKWVILEKVQLTISLDLQLKVREEQLQYEQTPISPLERRVSMSKLLKCAHDDVEPIAHVLSHYL